MIITASFLFSILCVDIPEEDTKLRSREKGRDRRKSETYAMYL